MKMVQDGIQGKAGRETVFDKDQLASVRHTASNEVKSFAVNFACRRSTQTLL